MPPKQIQSKIVFDLFLFQPQLLLVWASMGMAASILCRGGAKPRGVAGALAFAGPDPFRREHRLALLQKKPPPSLLLVGPSCGCGSLAVLEKGNRLQFPGTGLPWRDSILLESRVGRMPESATSPLCKYTAGQVRREGAGKEQGPQRGCTTYIRIPFLCLLTKTEAFLKPKRAGHL